MRGGLDDALDKLARRDELRRRAAGEANPTPPAVTELVEAIAGVVARHPELGVTVGAEGAGDPVLLHFFYADGQVQVTADNPPHAEPVSTARHADFEIDIEEPAQEPYKPASPAYGYAERNAPHRSYHGESDTAERRYGSFDSPPEAPYPAPDLGETSRDLGARMRDLGMASSGPPTAASDPAPAVSYPPHPFAATPPPPVPPQAPLRADPAQATRRIHAEQHRAPAEPSAAERAAAPQQRSGGMPAPLAKPVPLQVERPEETEMAARRLAALLRDDPTLLNQNPAD